MITGMLMGRFGEAECPSKPPHQHPFGALAVKLFSQRRLHHNLLIGLIDHLEM
jgi:hypothetical protein